MPATLDSLYEVLCEIHAELQHTRLLQEAAMGDTIAPADDFEDPKVRFDPKTWRGAPHKGKKASECPPEFLDHLARALTGMARQEQAAGKLYKDRPAYVYTLQGAARARRWALRKRLGWEPPEAEAPAANPFGGGGLASGGLGGGGIGSGPGIGGAALGDDAPIADDEFPFGANAQSTSSEDDDDPL